MLDAKKYAEMYETMKRIKGGDHVADHFVKNYPEIKPSFEQSVVEASNVASLPEMITCKIHGQYKLRTFPFLTKERFKVNVVCPICVDERDSALKQFKLDVDKERHAIKITENLKNSGLSKRHFNKTFNNYEADTHQKQKAVSDCKKLCSQMENSETVNNIIMIGGVGTGKTHLASAMVRDLITNGYDVGVWNLIDLIRCLKATWKRDAVRSEEEMLTHFTNLDLLIIDEVGIQFGSDTEKMFIFDIINGRYEEMLPTVIISNLDISGVKDLIGERCIDRLREDGGKVVAFGWESHR